MDNVIYRNGTLAVEIEDSNPVAITRDRGRYVGVPLLAEPSPNPEFVDEVTEAINDLLNL